MSDVDEQRDFYYRTAGDYDEAHWWEGEHAVAIVAFQALVRQLAPESVLEIGAGTGRTMLQLQRLMPNCKIDGIEPVASLREIGHAKGIPSTSLFDGNVMGIDAPDDSYDFVIESAVLHHVPDAARAVREMVRVARRGVMLSDCNRYAQGSRLARAAKAILRKLRLFDVMIYVQTSGKMSKWSEGDGVFYSYSVFDSTEELSRKFPFFYMLNTRAVHGANLLTDASHAMILALGKDIGYAE